MSQIIFTLGQTLKKLNVSKNKLSVETKTRPNLVYELINGTSKAIRFDTLLTLLDTLNQMAVEQGKEKIDIHDIFIYVDDNGMTKDGTMIIDIDLDMDDEED